MKFKFVEWETDAMDAPEGSVNLKGGITFSAPSGGCGEPGCKCSPGWWISFALPVNPSGKVRGYSIHFDDYLSMSNCLFQTNRQISEWLERPY